jgi:tol-pal system protein YbgF
MHMAFLTRGAGGLLLAAAFFAPAAHAAIFSDDEARRAILDLRQKVEQQNEQQRAAQAAQAKQQSDQTDQLRRSLLDLNNQIELQRSDNARLRGQIEELTRAVSELQRKQTDIQQGVDARMRKFEPQQVTLDDKQFMADPVEKRLYDDALGAVRKGDFDSAASGLSALLQRYPNSGYRDSALFWLGNAQYAQRNYKDAINSFRTLVTNAPDNPKAPEALLALANCQAELKDPKAARRTLDELIKAYPSSEAAQAGKQRLATLAAAK